MDRDGIEVVKRLLRERHIVIRERTPIETVLYAIRDTKLDKPFTNGPYKYSRHPIYFASFLIIISISIMSLSWIFLLIVILVAIYQLIVVPVEEKYCLNKYGKVYKEYMERTPKWIGIPKK
jgi:protein-S-isoprenylcysteine O-methyltransferase Ste14